jgi:glycosyltransferase involved in cell wall biosynthesis
MSGVVHRPLPEEPFFSVIVCTRNGAARIGGCLRAIGNMKGRFETIVVDDGSADGTAELVRRDFPSVKLLRLESGGLSAARNAGAAVAAGEVLAFTDDDCEPDGEWLQRLGKVFRGGHYDAAGGPNIPPPPMDWHQAVVSAAPGAPGHVMIDDVEADHLPGCNLAVTREAFAAVGGFDPVFHTAGDDVDFCWRLRDAGFRMAFAPDAFVWHHRRPHIRAYLRQQHGYGVAERMLRTRHPHRFTRRGATIWGGCIYDGSPVRVREGDIIYHGPMGNAPYQMIMQETARIKMLEGPHDRWLARAALVVAGFLANQLRGWARTRRLVIRRTTQSGRSRRAVDINEWDIPGHARDELMRDLLDHGWLPCGVSSGWDVEKDGARILLATERDADGKANTLVRMCGKAVGLPESIRPSQAGD